MTNLLISLLFPLMMAVTPVDSTDINTHPTFDKENCTCKGIPLYGKVKVMDNSFADFDVRITNGFPDLDVEVVKAFPNECGKWEFVEAFADFSVRFVEGFEDFTIRFVEGFPGTK